MKAGLEKRVAALEEREIYRVSSSCGSGSPYCNEAERGDTRAPRLEDLAWDPGFADIYDRCTKRVEKK